MLIALFSGHLMALLSIILFYFSSLFRATNGPGGWAIREAEGNPNRTEYVWLFDVDLKVNTVSMAQFKAGAFILAAT